MTKIILKFLFGYLRTFAVIVWFVVSFAAGFFVAIFQWGNPRNLQRTLIWFARGAVPLARLKVVYIDGHHMLDHQPCVYIGNHQSALDVAIYGHQQPPRTVGIGKKEVAWIPFFGWVWAASGSIFIDRGHRGKAFDGIHKAAKIIRERKVSVGIFPEGTRNRSLKGLLPFKKGAFYLAQEAGVPIVPMIVSPFHHVLDPKTKRLEGGWVFVKVLPPIPTQNRTKEEIDQLVVHARELMLATLNELDEKITLLKSESGKNQNPS